ncbi:MAG: hypothetical protein JST85_24615 [Acidobacteria bacterium]|nr:hypothetical protein [Acidobacteriota bacterium]
MIAESDLEINRIFLEGYIAGITMKVIGEKTKIELALAQCLRIINRKKTGAAINRWGKVARIIC